MKVAVFMVSTGSSGTGGSVISTVSSGLTIGLLSAHEKNKKTEQTKITAMRHLVFRSILKNYSTLTLFCSSACLPCF